MPTTKLQPGIGAQFWVHKKMPITLKGMMELLTKGFLLKQHDIRTIGRTEYFLLLLRYARWLPMLEYVFFSEIWENTNGFSTRIGYHPSI